MTNFWKTIDLSLLITWVGGCATQPTDQAKVPDNYSKLGVALVYTESEPGLEPNRINIFVNEEFIRVDEQSSPNDFILFDRKARKIYNVLSSDKTIAVITSQPVIGKPPIPIAYTYEKEESAAVPRDADNPRGYHYKFLVNDKACYNTVVVEDYLPEVVEAFKEFRMVLAGEHAAALGNIPPDQLDACDLALNIFEPTRHLEFGFPVREWGPDGRSRFLKDNQVGVAIENKYFELPAGYSRHAFGLKPH